MLQIEFLIHELAEKSGVSVRTIRYYIQEGLLPAPDNKGRYATFNEDYLLRLELIRRLKDAFLPLKEIKEKIAGLDMDGVRDLLAHLGTVQDARPEMPDETLFDGSFSLMQMNTPKPLDQSPPEDDALAYLDRVMQSQSIAENRPRLRPRPSPPAPPTAPAESWQRVELCPGVELHFRTALDPFLQRRIQQLIDYARHIFPSSIS